MPIRVFVLIAAVACLGLAMCAYSERSKPVEKPVETKPAQLAQPQQQAPQTPPQQKKPDEGDMSKKKPTYFPATKAPGAFR
jgi:hypothetical protein